MLVGYAMRRSPERTPFVFEEKSSFLAADGEKLDEIRKDFVAVFAGKCQGHLGGEQTIFHTDIVPPSAELTSKVFFRSR